MTFTIITDCADANAAARQITRTAGLFKCPGSLAHVTSDLEAAGNLVDVLDATGDSPAVVFANVAPRHGKGKKWPNGTPFAYFWYKKTLVVSTIDGYVLSLAKKFGLINKLGLLDVGEAMKAIQSAIGLSNREVETVVNTQFRSYEFVPRVAWALWNTIVVPSEAYDLDQIPHAPAAIWWVDNFGNCKTTITEDELLSLGQVDLPYYERLKDVPNGESALITGSSGMDDKRFIECVVQGESAAEVFGLGVGSELPLQSSKGTLKVCMS